MSPELEAAAAKLLEKVNTTGDFVIQQSPEVVQQFLLMERVYCGLCFAFTVLFTFLIWKVSIKAYKTYVEIVKERGDRYHRDEEATYLAIAWITGVVLCFASIITFSCGLSSISAFIAPKWHIVSNLIGAIR